jgi:hypothetical protein
MKFKLLVFLLLIAASSFAQDRSVVCDLTYVTTLQTFDVYHHDPTGVTLFKAKMYIDADGSPRAYGPGNSGLDWTANAGSPGNWWGIVTDAGGTPVIQGSGDPYPGMYVSTTSLVNSSYGSTNPLRYTNSEAVPFYVLPSSVVSAGVIHIGDVAYVYNTLTGQGCYAIYADAGPAASLGEGSIYLAGQIGVNPNARTGGTSAGIIDYVVFPNSGFGQGTIPSIAQIDSIGNLMIATVGGTGIVSCLGAVPDNTAPSTLVSAPSGWDTTGFTASFSDMDNSGGTGIETGFYQVCDKNATWRCNNARGFFNDDFLLPSIDPDWTTVAGVWNINAAGNLEESDESSSNTNIYAPLAQNLSDRYLYQWTGIIKGAGTNRRAGFHFFADQPDSTNRGNSYFIYFRLDDQKIQIYEVNNDSWGSGPVKDVSHTFAANQPYDFKILYDRITGLIRVYVDDVMSAEWTDPTPLPNGSFISFRNANCNYQVNDLRVYRSRNSTSAVSIGSGNEIRYENADPFSPSGMIRSITTDGAANISAVSSAFINVDRTCPLSLITVNDGSSADTDTTFDGTQLQASWSTASDPNSGLKKYYYAIGTSPGNTDVTGWTATGSTSFTETGLTLIPFQLYYVSVQAEDSALIRTPVITSDGQMYMPFATGIASVDDERRILLYPNPNEGGVHVKIHAAEGTEALISVTNIHGRNIACLSLQLKDGEGEAELDLGNESNGVYFVITEIGGKRSFNKIMLNR